MQTNAPGRGKLKVTGILYIIFGALGLSLSLALLAGGGLLLAAGAGTVGIALGAVAGILGAITVLTAVFYLILGILGVRNCDKPEKCGVNFVLGILVLVLVVTEQRSSDGNGRALRRAEGHGGQAGFHRRHDCGGATGVAQRAQARRRAGHQLQHACHQARRADPAHGKGRV